ncbi:MAG: GntP family permease [Defluviitaleaceae bacterium]|nr:GntP family permease [Defluviitaleaceae bacterium]
MIISLLGVIVGLAVAVTLSIKKVSPVVALFMGTVIGALVGGASITQSLQLLISGTQSVMGVIIRIVAGGILAGVLVESGAAETIARTIVNKLGEKRAVLAITLACMINTGVGVFITVSIVMLSPIALSVGQKANISKAAVLLALSGGAKAGNILSPNANAVAAAYEFGIPLSQVMIGGFIPGVVTLIATALIAGRMKKRGKMVLQSDVGDISEDESKLPSPAKAISAPAIAIALLMLSPLGDILGIEFLQAFQIDAFFALPIAAAAGMIIMGKWKSMIDYTNKGIFSMMPIVLLLIGAGAIGALVTGSEVPSMLIDIMYTLGIPGQFLAPLSGAMMASTAGSTVTGVILASSAFSDIIMGFGVSAVAGAVMVQAGAMWIDVMPHGNVFLGSKESTKMEMTDRLKLVPIEACIGFVLVVTATILHGFILA